MRYHSDGFISALIFWVDPLSKGQAQKVLASCSFCGVWKRNCVFLRAEGDKENVPSPGVRVTEEGDRHLLLPPHEAQRNRKPKHSPTLTEHLDNQDAPTVSLFFLGLSPWPSLCLSASKALLLLLIVSGRDFKKPLSINIRSVTCPAIFMLQKWSNMRYILHLHVVIMH